MRKKNKVIRAEARNMMFYTMAPEVAIEDLEGKMTELQSGFNTAFINSAFNSNLAMGRSSGCAHQRKQRKPAPVQQRIFLKNLYLKHFVWLGMGWWQIKISSWENRRLRL